MPRRCCMPACRGNYTAQERVNRFHFPREEDARREWIRAVHVDNFTPSDHSVVCELHFHAHGIERTTSAYDAKTGRLITAPLDRPRLRKGAIPALLPGSPKYLSTPSVSREHPED
ncbi:THAP domain-containing protein 2-like [Schistocerca piceifrons]|uniref:THAP domain-containing protein 2-like n=1 Tax=Schistocerca piceifrons TaxID=274613 RepID=UPI001F5E79C5|nr:THAP domain-containing protein 2-like [Schistocerca piceifrons]